MPMWHLVTLFDDALQSYSSITDWVCFHPYNFGTLNQMCSCTRKGGHSVTNGSRGPHSCLYGLKVRCFCVQTRQGQCWYFLGEAWNYWSRRLCVNFCYFHQFQLLSDMPSHDMSKCKSTFHFIIYLCTRRQGFS